MRKYHLLINLRKRSDLSNFWPTLRAAHRLIFSKTQWPNIIQCPTLGQPVEVGIAANRQAATTRAPCPVVQDLRIMRERSTAMRKSAGGNRPAAPINATPSPRPCGPIARGATGTPWLSTWIRAATQTVRRLTQHAIRTTK